MPGAFQQLSDVAPNERRREQPPIPDLSPDQYQRQAHVLRASIGESSRLLILTDIDKLTRNGIAE